MDLDSDGDGERGVWSVDAKSRILEIRGQTVEDRSQKLAKCLEGWRRKGQFRVLDGWRGELYPVYERGTSSKWVLNMERAATPLFGVATFGVHMTAYVKDEEGIKVWVPTRARTKETYPGMMDNTVAGGLVSGERPLECLVREAGEEASLPEELVREKAKACGTVTYFYLRDKRAGGETGLCQPECQYVYDLELPASVVPMPRDHEVESFRLMTVSDVRLALGQGTFKPNCALVLLDFFVRHGILTPENEPDYIEIVSRIHRRLDFSAA